MLFRPVTLSILTATALLAATSAQAQYYVQTYAPPPLYPYVVQPQPYGQQQSYPYILQRQPQARHVQRRHSRIKTDHNLVQELRRKSGKHNAGARLPKIDRTIVVREKPVVVEHQRVVDEPPVVIKRHRTVEVQVPPPAKHKRDMLTVPTNQGPAGLVIRAEAEVTIQGPDRMTIRLFRKRGADSNAQAD
jgi:hypothetical protein